MIIYINGRFLSQKITGVQRYALEVIKHLDEFITKNKCEIQMEFILVSPKNVKQDIRLNNIKHVQKGRLKGHLWEQIELPVFTRKGFLLNLCNTAPLIKKKQTVTIHDASVYAYPNGFSITFRMWYKFLYFVLGRHLENIFTVSNFSAKELQKYCGISKEKIWVNYLGINHILKIKGNELVLKKYDIPENEFVLAVSSLNRNKNFQMIIETAKIKKDVIFVIAGGFSERIFSTTRLDSLPNVKYIGYITDEDLVGLYKRASCFLYPSLYEGFGLPPLEAVACGCHTIVSNCASLPEVCEDSVLYCNPNDAKDIAKKLDFILKNKKKFIDKSKVIIEKYCWQETVKNIISFLSIHVLNI